MAFRMIVDGVERQVDILARVPRLVLAIDGRRVTVDDPGTGEDGRDSVTIDGMALVVARVQTLTGLAMRSGGVTLTADLPGIGDATGDSASGDLRAPMPGTVVAVDASVGDTVAVGDPILTIESMKLQMVLTARRAGVVAEILVTPGDGFDKDQLLARLADTGKPGEDTSDA